MHDRKPQNDEQVPDVERIAAVGEHASVDERVSPQLTILASPCDVDETDDERPPRLTSERDEQPDRIRHVIDTHVATRDTRPRAEPDQQQHQRKEQVSGLEEKMPRPRQRGRAAYRST